MSSLDVATTTEALATDTPASRAPLTASQRGVAAVVELVVRRYAEGLTMRDLTEAAGMPANSLTRAFNRLYGMSPKRWVWYFRTVLAAELIVAAPEESLAMAWHHCGFVSAAHFSRRFREIFAAPPTALRARFVATGVRPRPALADKPQFRRLAADVEAAVQRALTRLAERDGT